MITADLILTELRDRVAKKIPISKDDWLDIAFKLNTLILDENETLFTMKQAVAIRKRDILNLQEKKNVAALEIQVEALDEYKQMMIQESKINQIMEFIRIAKKQSDLL